VVIIPNAVISGDITLGQNCRIGANAVVTVDVPDSMLVVGHNKIKDIK